MYEKGIVSETCESNTPYFRIIISNLPFSTLSQLAKPPSLTPYVKAKKNIANDSEFESSNYNDKIKLSRR